MIGKEHTGDLIGATLYGPSSAPIGAIGQVYLDDATDQPAWVTVQTGLFGPQESFVPLSGAQVTAEGVVVGFSPDLVKDAPRADPAGGHLKPSDEAHLYRHYGLSLGDDEPRRMDWSSQGRHTADTGVTRRHLRRYVEPGTGRASRRSALIDLDAERALRQTS